MARAQRDGDQDRARRSRPLVVVAALVALQGVAVVLIAAFLLVELVAERPRSVGAAVGVLALAALGGCGLLVVARGLVAARRWSRSPAVVTQLIVVPVALAAAREAPLVGVPMLVWGGAVIVLLFVPSVSHALDG